MTEETNSNGLVAPGDLIRSELKRRNWTQDDLAKIIGKPTPRVNELIQGKLSISAELATALGAAFGTTAAFWLQVETARLLAQAASAAEPVRKRARLYELAPVKEMQKRGWIKSAESPEELEREVLRYYRIANLDEEPLIHGAMRKTAPSIAATPAQRVWAFRVRHVAATIPSASLSKYDESRLDACRADLRKLASYSTGVSKAPRLLATYGIRFVVIEGLAGAKLDGFATWLDDESPVIGMSMRYDRLDWFWFTLGHELSHICHRDIAPVDGDVSGSEDLLEVKSPMERRADAESAAMFIPPDELKSFALRAGPLFPIEKINQFANRIKIHPTIIIGQLKNNGAMGYSAHSKSNAPVREAVVKAAITDGWGKTIHAEMAP